MAAAQQTATASPSYPPGEGLRDEERELIRIVRAVRKAGGKVTVTMRGLHALANKSKASSVDRSRREAFMGSPAAV